MHLKDRSTQPENQVACCAECQHYDDARAEAAEADAAAYAYDQGRLYNADETQQQAKAEAARVDELLNGWAKGKPPAKRPYRVHREARATAAAMKEPQRVSWMK